MTKFNTTSVFIDAKLVSFLIAVVVTIAAGCAPPAPTSEVFSPAPDNYENPLSVTITLPEADQIFYTLDGSTPATNCLEYADGEPIAINKLTQIKVMYTSGGQEIQVSEDAIYNILSQDTSVFTETNHAMALDWLDYEKAVRHLNMFHNNCGAERVQPGSCDDSIPPLPLIGGLGRLWWVCDNYNPNGSIGGGDRGYTDGSFTGHELESNGSLAQCQAEGHGWASWIVDVDGTSTFTYSNFKLTQTMLDELPLLPSPLLPLVSGRPSIIPQVLSMTVSGQNHGFFDAFGNGVSDTVAFDHFGNASDLTAHLKVTGDRPGTVVDDITFILKMKTKGSYTAWCDDAIDPNCASTPLSYFANNWARFSPDAASCTP